ncbi:MAG: RNA-dependent DNA polymerase [Phycisphaerae bacterium]|nr:RNA-dependent DNA polymerase [Phycisphaerae bacterium]
MKRYGNLWDKLVSWDNLVLAAYKARKGKRAKACVQRFEFNLEAELLQLQDELVNGIYMPGNYVTHWITRPKARKISAAPYRDRVLHHGMMNVLEPILDKHFHPDSYACRKEKGTHAAVDRLQHLIKHNQYALQCDIQKFFPSIDHEILKGIFRRLIKDQKLLKLMDMIVDCSNEQEAVNNYFKDDDLFMPFDRRCGLPIGNLTSQWFANWYLSGLDHYITKQCHCGSYVRYCDDFIILAKDRATLIDLRNTIKDYLDSIRLKMHTNKNFIRPVNSGLTFTGMRIWPYYRLLRKDNIKAFKKRIKWMQKAYAYNLIDRGYIQPRLASWIGHSSHTNNYKLLCRLCKDWRFKRAKPDELSRYPRRQLEQQRQQLPGCQSQQQQPEQHQQQHRVPGVSVSCSVPAFSEYARNDNVHGYYQRGRENPRRCPELMGNVSHSQISTRPDATGRDKIEGSIWPIKKISHLAA